MNNKNIPNLQTNSILQEIYHSYVYSSPPFQKPNITHFILQVITHFQFLYRRNIHKCR